MQIRIEWQEPILLFRNKRPSYTDDQIKAIENRAGVYYFARQFGSRSAPFYIGETRTLQKRLKEHFKSARIMDALHGRVTSDTVRIAQGSRYFHYGYLLGNAQDQKSRLKIVQRYLINEALSMQLPLLNMQGTVIQTHQLLFEGKSSGRGMYPKSADVERR